jgi:hypothetical protein
MGKQLALAIILVFAGCGAVWAQQPMASTPNRGLGAGTPGVETGTTGTTYATPGADQRPSVPGGGIPMGASTQDSSNLSDSPRTFNNGGGSKDR